MEAKVVSQPILGAGPIDFLMNVISKKLNDPKFLADKLGEKVTDNALDPFGLSLDPFSVFDSKETKDARIEKGVDRILGKGDVVATIEGAIVPKETPSNANGAIRAEIPPLWNRDP